MHRVLVETGRPIDSALAASVVPSSSPQQQQKPPSPKKDKNSDDDEEEEEEHENDVTAKYITQAMETQDRDSLMLVKPETEQQQLREQEQAGQEESYQDFLRRQVAVNYRHSGFDNNDYYDMANDNNDNALYWVSSELGIRQCLGQPLDDASVATLLLLERAFDTAEDILMHLRRIPYDQGWMKRPGSREEEAASRGDGPVTPQPRRKRVVVLGSVRANTLDGEFAC